MISQLIFLIIFAGLFSFLAYRETDWALGITIILLPTYLIRFTNNISPFTLLEVIIVLLFVVWLIKTIKQKEKIFWSNKILLIAFIAAALLATFTSPDLRQALGLFKAYFLEPALFFLVLINVIKSKKQIKLISWALGFLLVWLSIYGAVQFFTGVGIPDPWYEQAGRRIVSVYEYPNALGLILAPIIAYFVALIARVKFFNRQTFWWGVIIIMLGVFALLAAVSQGAWLGLLLAMIFLSFFIFPWKKILLVLLLVTITAFAFPQTRDYLMPLITLTDVSGDVRKVMWQGTWNLLKARPLLGAGLAGFPHYYEQYRLIKHTEFLLYPHNIGLNFWAELGIFGLLVVIYALSTFFRTGFRLLKTKNLDYNWTIALMTAMVCLIGHGLVDVPYFKNDLAILFWVFFGMMTIIWRWQQDASLSK
ncbi:O-antigen ligase family protein [Patescibacteria group bacterium]|nr:O-antigen ligase family protein [Patescibacteria group bacterium]